MSNPQEVKNTAVDKQCAIFNAAHDAAIRLEDIRNQHLKAHRDTYPQCCVDAVLNAKCARTNAYNEWVELNRLIAS